jgi:translocation protein SEC63
MKLEFDEGGEKFLYFILPVYAFILLLVTYWLWPNTEETKTVPHPIHTYDFARYHDEYRLSHANESSRKRQGILAKIGLVLAWIVLLVLAYRVSLIKIEYEEYDPFAILDVAREASISEIRRAYHELSKIHHPDRDGDPEKFKEIAKAYRTLTDEKANENWRKYGNPDGPREIHLGFAIPKWFFDRKNSMFVLLVYTSLFAIVLPVIIVCVRK